MVLPKGHFKTLEPLSNGELLAALSSMNAEAARIDSQYEATKGALKELREKRDDLKDRTTSALKAHEAGEPVWLLKDGKVSAEGPDGQGTLVPPGDMPGPAAGKGGRKGREAAAVGAGRPDDEAGDDED